jgi:hypothetical protein
MFSLAHTGTAAVPSHDSMARNSTKLTRRLLTRVIMFINPTRLGRKFPSAWHGKTDGEALLVASSKLSILASRTHMIVPEITL